MNNFSNSKVEKRKDLLMYMANKNPQAMYAAMSMTVPTTLGEVGDDAQTALNEAAASESWFDKIVKAASAVGLIITQRDIAKINLERVKQGKEPLSTDVTGTAINLGIAAETRKVLVWTAVGLGGLLALVLLRKKR
jgi:hypothetical protein